MSKPVVAIVGRQNVGKSALLNRLAGKRIAIVEDMPGTTRDRILADVSWQGAEFTVIDTGGIELDPRTTVAEGVREQINAAIDTADVIIFLVDVQAGITASDLESADLLRRSGKPLLLAANKADNRKLEESTAEFYELGLGEPMPISAHHGRGTADLLDRLVTMLPSVPPEEQPPGVVKLAIAGRPNVGKSMLLNALVGEKRSIVDEIPGTTRDAIDTYIDYKGQGVLLIDTAGIRRRGRISGGVEKYSVMRSLRAVDRADVVLLVMDASEGITANDTHIAGYVLEATKGVVLVMNKWDLVEDREAREWEHYIREHFKFMPYAPVLFISAKTGEGVNKVLPQGVKVYEERNKRFGTSVVNNVIQEAAAAHMPPQSGRKRLKLLYATQAEVNPPTFVFFVNDAKLMHFSYRRYLENRLRMAFGFTGTPIRIIIKTRREDDSS